jgi:GNAT superfamily N-acetyltransferase
MPVLALLYAALIAVLQAPTAFLELIFANETRRFDQSGEPNSFVLKDDFGTTMGNGPAASRRWESKEILVYDDDGQIVGRFSIVTKHPTPTTVGAFKIVVRPDARRRGWGRKLLDRAAEAGIDLVTVAGPNHYSAEGRQLMLAWLARRALLAQRPVYLDSQLGLAAPLCATGIRIALGFQVIEVLEEDVCNSPSCLCVGEGLVREATPEEAADFWERRNRLADQHAYEVAHDL